jgi:hypothetical protein
MWILPTVLQVSTLEFYSDCTCPFAYLALRRVREDEAGTMPVSAVHDFLRSIAGDPDRLSAFRLELAGYV